MDFAASAPSWDPLGTPVPADLERRLADAELAAQNGSSVPWKNKKWLYFCCAGGFLFVFGGFVTEILVLLGAPRDNLFVMLAPWFFGFDFLIVGIVLANKESAKQQRIELLAKCRFAKANHWVMASQNRYKELRSAFPAFMTSRGNTARITEEWWGKWRRGESEYDVWLADLVCQVPTGSKSSRTEYSAIVGLRVRSQAPAAVSLVPEDIGHKLLHLFKGEYKTGNAEFDAAFSVGTGSAQPSSSSVPSVLTPPLIAAMMELRGKGRRAYLHRERDMLLLRTIDPGVMNGDPMLRIVLKDGVVTTTDRELLDAIASLVEPVIALAEKAGV